MYTLIITISSTENGVATIHHVPGFKTYNAADETGSDWRTRAIRGDNDCSYVVANMEESSDGD